MRAAVLKSPGSVNTRPLELTDAPDPEPAADEVLLRVRACGLCRTDMHVVEGELPARRTPATHLQRHAGPCDKFRRPGHAAKPRRQLVQEFVARTCMSLKVSCRRPSRRQLTFNDMQVRE